MRNLLNAISNSFLSRDLGDCSLKEVSDLAGSQPYSGSAQLLLAQKLKDEANPSWEQQWQKTLLYFNNPAALHYWFTKKPILSPWEKKITDNSSESNHVEPDVRNREDARSVITETPAKSVTPTAEQEVSDTHPSQDPQTAAVTDKEQPLPAFTIQHQGASNMELVFTPYHTVDYFASQGIKLSDEKNTRDRFTQQLKSFSDWLKEMKRLPEAERSARLVGKEERKVEEMAGKSLTGENAITEAMAEIWIKQGNRANALAVYQKLSLQNPLKRAYFAAKIEHLKKSL